MTDPTSFPKPGTMAETLAVVDSITETTVLAPMETLNSQEQRNALIAAYEDPSIIYEGHPDNLEVQTSFLVRSRFATATKASLGFERHRKILTPLGMEWAQRALRARVIQQALVEPMRIIAQWTTNPEAVDDLYNKMRGDEASGLPQYRGDT